MRERYLYFIVGVFLVSCSHSVFADTYQVNAHYCYGNDEQWFIQGRVIEERKANDADVSDNWMQNLWRKIRQLENEEKENVAVGLVVQGQVFSLDTDDEGFFDFVFRPDSPISAGWYEIRSLYNAKTAELCRLLVPDKRNKVAIISDFDDTVIVSDVTSKPKAVLNTLTLNYKQRVLVDGMPQRYRDILQRNPVPDQSLLFFVTGSHKQLQKGIEGFLDYHHFPQHTIIAKKISGRDPDPLLDQYKYKREKIIQILKLYPEVKFTLFGDDGEKDPEVYDSIRQEFPDQVDKIWIRKVNADPNRKTYPAQRYF